MARKEVIQLRRDPRSLILAFLLPIALTVLFGYAISFDVDDIRFAVLDQDASADSRALLDAFRSSGYFTLTERVPDRRSGERLLEAGRVRLLLVVPPDFSRGLHTGVPPALQVLLDGSDANTATIAQAYAEGIVRGWALRALGDPRLGVPLEVRSRIWYNEELSSRNMIVPGLVAVVMMIIAAMLTSLTIAREWERGTMEQLAATPVHRLEVVLGKMAPYFAIGLVDVALVSVVGVALFGVPFRGSVVLLALLSAAFIVGALGLGMFISAVARSQLLATQLALILTFLPAFLLSGFMFAIDVMPAPLRAFSYLIPARYFLVVTRGIFLKGVGADVLAVQGLLMLAFAALGLAAATRAFRKQIES